MRTALLFATLALLATAARAEEKTARAEDQSAPPDEKPTAQKPAPDKPAERHPEDTPPAPAAGARAAADAPRIDPLPNIEVTVVFLINEHAKVTVKEIRFVGNHAIGSEELKAAMLTQEGSPFSFVTSAGTYREEAFQRDEIVLQGLYFDIGYIYVKFGRPAIELSPDKRFIYITVTIDEGEPFDVGKIDVGGDLLLSREDLLKLVGT